VKINYQSTEKEILNATREELEKALLTCDGAGIEVKRICRDEIIERAYKNGQDNMQESLFD